MRLCRARAKFASFARFRAFRARCAAGNRRRDRAATSPRARGSVSRAKATNRADDFAVTSSISGSRYLSRRSNPLQDVGAVAALLPRRFAARRHARKWHKHDRHVFEVMLTPARIRRFAARNSSKNVGAIAARLARHLATRINTHKHGNHVFSISRLRRLPRIRRVSRRETRRRTSAQSLRVVGVASRLVQTRGTRTNTIDTFLRLC